jgi:hypothetical protein
MLRTLLAPLLLLFSSHLSTEQIPLDHCHNLLEGQTRVSGTRFLFLVDTASVVSILNVKSFAPGEPFIAAKKSQGEALRTT